MTDQILESKTWLKARPPGAGGDLQGGESQGGVKIHGEGGGHHQSIAKFRHGQHLTSVQRPAALELRSGHEKSRPWLPTVDKHALNSKKQENAANSHALRRRGARLDGGHHSRSAAKNAAAV